MVITELKQKRQTLITIPEIPEAQNPMPSALPTEAAGRGAQGRLRAYEDGLG